MEHLIVANMLASGSGFIMLIAAEVFLARKRRQWGLERPSFVERNLSLNACSCLCLGSYFGLFYLGDDAAQWRSFCLLASAALLFYCAMASASRDSSWRRLAGVGCGFAVLELVAELPGIKPFGFSVAMIAGAFSAVGVGLYATYRNAALVLAAFLLGVLLSYSYRADLSAFGGEGFWRLGFAACAYLQVMVFGGVALVSGQPPISYLQSVAWAGAGYKWTKFSFLGILGSTVLVAVAYVLVPPPPDEGYAVQWAVMAAAFLLLTLAGAMWSLQRHFPLWLRPKR